MALWQFPLLLVPAGVARAARVDMDAEHWAQQQPRAETLRAVRALLAPLESWSEEIEMFGTKRGDHISIVFDDDRKRILEIVVRIDCSQLTLNLELVDRLCEVISADAAIAIVDRHGRPLKATRAAVLDAIAASPAGKFSVDPKRAVLEAAAALKKDETPN